MIDELKQWEYDKGYEKGKADTLKVIEDIKAEIEFERDRKIGGEFFEAVQYKSFKKCLEIIDKHMRGDNE